MPSVRFPAAMKYYLGDQNELTISANTVARLIDSLVAQYPTVKVHLLDSDGNLRRYFNIFVNGEHIRELNGMDTSLKEDDKVIVMASAAGG